MEPRQPLPPAVLHSGQGAAVGDRGGAGPLLRARGIRSCREALPPRGRVLPGVCRGPQLPRPDRARPGPPGGRHRLFREDRRARAQALPAPDRPIAVLENSRDSPLRAGSSKSRARPRACRAMGRVPRRLRPARKRVRQPRSGALDPNRRLDAEVTISIVWSPTGFYTRIRHLPGVVNLSVQSSVPCLGRTSELSSVNPCGFQCWKIV